MRLCVRAAVPKRLWPYNGDGCVVGHSVFKSLGAQFKRPFQGFFKPPVPGVPPQLKGVAAMLNEVNTPFKGSGLACFGAAARRTHERSHALGGERA